MYSRLLRSACDDVSGGNRLERFDSFVEVIGGSAVGQQEHQRLPVALLVAVEVRTSVRMQSARTWSAPPSAVAPPAVSSGSLKSISSVSGDICRAVLLNVITDRHAVSSALWISLEFGEERLDSLLHCLDRLA